MNAEDHAHAEVGLPTWRRLLDKRERIAAFLRLRDNLPKGRFLEIGGGLCYASALMVEKGRPDLVIATDISPRYLWRHARPLGRFMGTPADVYLAADARHLPFRAGSFAAVYSAMVLYRVPDPYAVVQEIQRVICPGGQWIGVERATPPWGPWARRDAREMHERNRVTGLAERPMTYRDWQRVAGIVEGRVTPIPGRRLRARWLRRLVNLVWPIHVRLDVRGRGVDMMTRITVP